MKITLWDILAILALLGACLVAMVVALIFTNPHSALNPFPPSSLPPTLVIPTDEPTAYQLPPTWTPTLPAGSAPVVEPTNNLTPSITTTRYVVPSFTSTNSPTVTSTVTRTPTVTRTVTLTPTWTIQPTYTPYPTYTNVPTATLPPTVTITPTTAVTNP
jgi:hypothetical protein